jgi:hypothetical protein
LKERSTIVAKEQQDLACPRDAKHMGQSLPSSPKQEHHNLDKGTQNQNNASNEDNDQDQSRASPLLALTKIRAGLSPDPYQPR